MFRRALAWSAVALAVPLVFVVFNLVHVINKSGPPDDWGYLGVYLMIAALLVLVLSTFLVASVLSTIRRIPPPYVYAFSALPGVLATTGYLALLVIR